MKTHLLKKLTTVSALSLAIAACGVEEGKDYEFNSKFPVTFSEEPFVVETDEMEGTLEIDLLQGAMVDGQPLTATSDGLVLTREFLFEATHPSFITPQIPGLGQNQYISPFSVSEDGTKLLVNTDQFDEALRLCDDTDVRGATDADGNPTGDGYLDFPKTVTYNISYIVDNGYEYPAQESGEKRNLTFTINAISDPVTGVQAFDIELAAGETKQALTATLPAYACNSNLTYSTQDITVASVDDMGLITGEGRGETTITAYSEENPNLSATANVTVTAGFYLSVANQDFNELGAPLGTKNVPTCSAIGIEVEPTIVNDELMGDYTYDWTVDAGNAVYLSEEDTGGFGKTGSFTNNLGTGDMATITVGYKTGYTGATEGEDVKSQTVEVTAQRNYACDPEPNADGTTFYVSDLGLNGGGWGPSAVHVAGGFDGMALQITSNGDANGVLNVVQQQWNQVFNYHAATYGRGEASVGRTFKFSVWAKLNQLPADGEDVKLEHTLLPWLCNGCDGLAGFDPRRAIAGTVTATLKPTTDWQLVEFTNPLSGNGEWTVPDHWNVSTAVFMFWDVYGLGNAESILLDNYGIVEVK
ncbi:hypothetical protein FE810_12055 [Thalassotalea litorea]|uniref:BIG2 domain-containing protein n=1 Tax=Thalassotalea litorea TaxID=2020715 RepID=A0A5R9IR04_9GAMM|nr:Ig-like domain-containing protein [Thalassotalea litorea]TLU64328.1 hypothetical protein FE810_12055 [Thalassotalea litorea]